jgi:hypothetical protein
MIQVKCPQCSTSLALKQAPASGKVKCPKCAAIVTVPTTAQAPAAPQSAGGATSGPRPAATARPAQGGRPSGPGQATRPAAPARGASTSFADDIDFRSIPVPTAPAPSGFFPMANDARVYDGPVSLDPIPKQKSEDDDEEEELHSAEPTKSRGKGNVKKNQAKVIGIIGGLVLLLAVGGGAAYMLMGSGGGGAPEVDVVAQAAAAAPSGFQAKSLQNCVVLMPAGSAGDAKIPGAIEAEIVTSDATESVFLLAAMDGGTIPIETLQMKKKTNNSLGGEMLGGTDTVRNGYKGIKGVQDQSPFLPRMSVEVFHHDGRFVIIGHVTGSEMRAAGGGTAVGSNLAEEAKEVEVFYNSFKIGPPKGGFFGN